MKRPVFLPALLVSLLSPVLFCIALAGASASPAAPNLHFETSPVNILGSKVLVQASPSLRYLNAPEAKALLIKEGNPPDAVSDIEGLLLPASASGQDNWFVVITENTDGHVSDADAAKIDYDDLLSQMKSATQDNNKARTEAGYDAVTLMGWAEVPTYDPAQHSMVWAKDVVFGDPKTGAEGGHHTLNYAVRVLGRQDVLELNAVGSYDQLAQIKAGMRQVLPAVQFTAGNRYQDFNEGSDKLATYGLAGLIAGGVVAQKVGLFGVLLLFLKKGWILIAGGLALVRRVMGGVANARANRAERTAEQQAQAVPVSTTPSPATFAVHPDLLPRMSLNKQEDSQGAGDKPLGRHGG
ncbi:DUF2167 domain-containing protein [Deinococcus altitudinis]|uniref:DUF2167 domain-containing protein n=1 Tax=Deinococcus altitudinis TaxID=468914 RepID=UPI0038920A1E